MAISAEQLNIILSAKDKEFARAMERNQRRVERFSKQSQRNLNKTSKSFDLLSSTAARLGGTAALGAASAAMVRTLKDATNMAFEIENLARVSGTGIERFQELAHASKSVGIEQEKLADILKDVNDKFGDYYATGAGPLVDFFDNIAPKVGLAKDAFAGLSSDQALGLYVKSLQDANVSQSELTFYMEAIASDATALTPLFINNAAAMDKLAQSGRDLGLVMDEDIVQKGAKMKRQWQTLVASMRTTFNTFAIDVISSLDNIFNVSDDADFSKMQGQITSLTREREKLNQEIAAILHDRSYQDVNRPDQGLINNRLNEIALINQEVDMISFALDALNDKIVDRDAVLSRLNEDGGTGTGTGSGTGGTENTIKEMEAVIQAYDSLAGQLDPVIAATNKYAAAQKTVNDALAYGHINSDQARATLEKAKLELDMATGAAMDLSSVFNTVESSMENAFMGIIDGTASAKDAFKSMASSVIKELFRVLVVQQLVGSVGGGGIAGAIGGMFGMASGGAVNAGQPYVTGEHGRELFVPSQSGRILSVAQSKDALSGGGGGGVTVNQTINVSTGVQQTVRTEIKQLMPQIAESAKSAVADAKLRGGSYGRSFA